MMANKTELWLEGEAIAPETLAIDPAASERARQTASSCQHPNRQWSIYLQTLIEAAFQHWLAAWGAELPAHPAPPLDTPQAAELLSSTSYQQVGPFRLGLLRLDSTSATVPLPRAAIALPDYCAHFYVAIEVYEELQQARICGFLRYDQLRDRLHSTAMTAERDWSYPLPLAWFNPVLGELLLALRCLEASAIALPLPAAASPEASRLRAELAPLRAQLHADEQEIWEVLNWSQFAALLTAPSLPSWFLRPPAAAERVLNAGAWLSDRLDNLAAELNWVLLPVLQSRVRSAAGAAGMRSPLEELDSLIVQLERQGTQIAPEARGAYQDFALAETMLRLYAVTWAQCDPQQLPEWKLLLVLGTPDGSSLPDGTTLRVSDNQHLLVERTMQQSTDASYLYARVAGAWDETFAVEVVNPDKLAHAFPVFAFQPRV